MYNDVMIYQIIVTCDLMRRCFITMWLLKLWSIGKIGSATWILTTWILVKIQVHVLGTIDKLIFFNEMIFVI
jgi:hypothetical protein